MKVLRAKVEFETRLRGRGGDGSDVRATRAASSWRPWLGVSFCIWGLMWFRDPVQDFILDTRAYLYWQITSYSIHSTAYHTRSSKCRFYICIRICYLVSLCPQSQFTTKSFHLKDDLLETKHRPPFPAMQIRNSCSSAVWCSHFQVWCRPITVLGKGA